MKKLKEYGLKSRQEAEKFLEKKQKEHAAIIEKQEKLLQELQEDLEEIDGSGF